MSVRQSNFALAALSAASLTLGASGALAQGATVSEVVVQAPHRVADSAAPTEKVSYADLDIGSSAGAHVLISRIQTAAKHVCAIEKGDMPENATYAACLNTAASNAVRDVASPTVSSVYSEAH
jgi:UrcA family protein